MKRFAMSPASRRARLALRRAAVVAGAGISAVAASGPAGAAGGLASARAAWVVQRSANRPGAPISRLDAVSCTSARACVAVGGAGSSSDLTGPGEGGAAGWLARWPASAAQVTGRTLAERWNGTRWAIQPTPNPAGATVSRFLGVSCSSRAACTAVGYATYGSKVVPLAERWNGARWTVQRTPSPAAATISDLSGVSCPSARDCVAVGDQQSPVGVGGLIEIWNGARWTVASPAQPAGSGELILYGVSCSSGLACTAAGTWIPAHGAEVPVAQRWTGGNWRLQSVPGPGEFLAVSCPSFHWCTAVGDQPGAGETLPLAQRWNGSTWAAQTATRPRRAPQARLVAVSCATSSSCAAVGWVGFSFGPDKPLAVGVNFTSHAPGVRTLAEGK